MGERKEILLKRMRLIVFSGLLAGMSEVIFIMCYSFITKSSLILIGSEISKSLFHFNTNNVSIALLGLVIHFILSFIITSFFIMAILAFLRSNEPKKNLFVSALGYLALIWCLNFVLILPKINITFLNIFPYWVTFISKLLFGLTMAICLVKSEKVDYSDWRYLKNASN